MIKEMTNTVARLALIRLRTCRITFFIYIINHFKYLLQAIYRAQSIFVKGLPDFWTIATSMQDFRPASSSERSSPIYPSAHKRKHDICIPEWPLNLIAFYEIMCLFGYCSQLNFRDWRISDGVRLALLHF
jgi:hypothetical protein